MGTGGKMRYLIVIFLGLLVSCGYTPKYKANTCFELKEESRTLTIKIENVVNGKYFLKVKLGNIEFRKQKNAEEFDNKLTEASEIVFIKECKKEK